MIFTVGEAVRSTCGKWEEKEEEEERFLQDKVILGKRHFNFVSRIWSFPDFGFPGFFVSQIFDFPDFGFPGF